MATLQHEMIRSELEEVVGEEYISTRESDRLVYATDWFWLPQMWLDRGAQPTLPDFIVHPG
ncbi:MAG: FAD-binding oxidoreductase, partial [Anaerolineae bacterium]|nr:FAD-binding oxidoreductase [Anaerolineae bacterium]